jgi:RimJ/RimL family protein N-acetyltransferase
MAVIETPRLILRQWQASDYAPFADLNASTAVMEYFHSVLSRAESDALVDRLIALIDESGWGFWATEIQSSGKLIGFVGLVPVADEYPFAPGVEIGWRLAEQFWGHGYASEAAKASLHYAFSELVLPEVVSITTCTNLKSQNVMKKIGMLNTKKNFYHHAVALDSPLSEHVLYKISAAQWQLCYDARK